MYVCVCVFSSIHGDVWKELSPTTSTRACVSVRICWSTYVGSACGSYRSSTESFTRPPSLPPSRPPSRHVAPMCSSLFLSFSPSLSSSPSHPLSLSLPHMHWRFLTQHNTYTHRRPHRTMRRRSCRSVSPSWLAVSLSSRSAVLPRYAQGACAVYRAFSRGHGSLLNVT